MNQRVTQPPHLQAVNLDAAHQLGLNFREIDRFHRQCKVVWSDWKKEGSGIRGAPKLNLKTVKRSAGFSILTQFNLGGMELDTGARFPIDDLLRVLSPIFMKIFDGFLNALASFITTAFCMIAFNLRKDFVW